VTGTPAFDAVLFAVVPVALLALTLTASVLPAVRASRVEPVTALRSE
jgi:ABC-type lipoprotein release transport system permease subunit